MNRRCLTLFVALCLLPLGPQPVRAERPNVVQSVAGRSDGARTVLTIHGSGTPSFTAYRLERPARLVIDLADGRFSGSDGPIEVDTWAVGQVTVSEYSEQSTRIARVMIALKRPAAYEVRAVGGDVIVTVTPDEAPPATAPELVAATERARAEAAAAETARQRSTAAAAFAEAARQQSTTAAASAEAARRQSTAAAASAEAARQRAASEAAVAETTRQRAAAELSRIEAQRAEAAQQLATAQGAVERHQRELDALKRRVAIDSGAHRADAARATAAQAELARVEQQRAAAATAATRASEELSRLVSERDRERASLAASRREMAELTRARSEEEGRMARARVELDRLGAETARLAVAQQAARQAAEREATRREAVRAEVERLAVQRAAELSRLEAARAGQHELEVARAAARRVAAEAEGARAEAATAKRTLDALAAAQRRELAQTNRELDGKRAQVAQLAEQRSQEEARLSTARLEAQRLADRLTAETTRLAAAQSEARAAAEKEATRLEALRAEATRLAAERVREVARLEAARASQLEVAAARREADRLNAEAKAARAQVAEAAQRLAQLKAAQSSESSESNRRLAEALARASATDSEIRHLDAVRSERGAEQRRLDAARAETARLTATRRQEEQRLVETRAEQQRLASEIKGLEVARAEAARVANQERTELARIERARAAATSSGAAERARLDEDLAEARRRFATAQAEQRRFDRALADAKAAPAPSIALQQKSATPTVTAAAPATREAALTSVEFIDRPEVAQVVIGLTGAPRWSLLAGGATPSLRLAATDLPARLARALDTAAFGGPVSRVSTYADPEDPGAVRIAVGLASAVEPTLREEPGRLIWEFPKPPAARTITASSYPPPLVAGYGLNSLPLQVAEPGAGGGQTLRPRTSGSAQKRFTGAHIDLDFKDADIHNILRLLADVGQVNIITSDDVKGQVTIRMRDVPWDQALDVVLRAKGLGMVRDRNLIRVAQQAQLEKELEADIAREKQMVELKPLTTRLVPLSYATAESVMPRVQDMLSGRAKISVDARTNTLIISDLAGNIALAEELIRNLDTQTPQVLIEARIVEARTSFTRELGVQWGGSGLGSAATGNPTGLAFPSTIGVGGGAADGNAPTAGLLPGAAASPNYVVNLPAAAGTGSGGALGFTFGSLNGAFNVNLRLSAAETTGSTRILSAPKITTLDNIEATIEQGTSVPASTTSAQGTQTQFIDALLKLTVKPHITNEGSVIMQINLQRNEPDFSRLSNVGVPSILKRQAKTEMLVRDGETAVIGGIYSRNSANSIAKVPWLGDIPILGWLFKSRKEADDRTEMLIFITPRIVNRAAATRR